MGLSLDMSFFSIVCELDGALYTQEVEISDMRPAQIVNDLRSGQFENIKAIFEFNPAEGWCNDVTEDLLAVSRERQERPDEPDTCWSDYRSERIDGPRAGVTVRAAA